MFLPVLLYSTLLASPQFGPSGKEVILNEYSQPLQYQLDIRLEASRQAELAGCIERATGLDTGGPLTDYLVAEAEGMNLTYLPERNHMALIATDFTVESADRARETGRQIKECLEIFPTSATN